MFARHPPGEASCEWNSSCYDRPFNGATMRKLIFFLFFLALSTTIVCAQQYDLVLEGGS